MLQDYPILEFDSTPEAIIEPKRLFDETNIPVHGIICFYHDVITKLLEQQKLHPIAANRRDANSHPIGAVARCPIYELTFQKKKLLVFHPGIGSPVVAAIFEEVIALGCRKFISCGTAGTLDRMIAAGHIVVPTSAIRDEGTSYHYLPPSREVKASIEAVTAIDNVLREHQYEYLLVKTWTTDAIFRETAAKVLRRKSEGCSVVEMEAASLFAVAQFRSVQIAQILYASDDVSNLDWDNRFLPNRAALRENLFWLAVEACLEL